MTLAEIHTPTYPSDPTLSHLLKGITPVFAPSMLLYHQLTLSALNNDLCFLLNFSRYDI